MNIEVSCSRRVFESAAGSMFTAGATTLLLGNPVRNRGFFHRTHNELADSWRTWHVSSIDNPLVSPDFVSDMLSPYFIVSALSIQFLDSVPAQYSRLVAVGARSSCAGRMGLLVCGRALAGFRF